MRKIKFDIDVQPNVIGLQILFCSRLTIDFGSGDEFFNGVLVTFFNVQFTIGYTVKEVIGKGGI